MGSSATVAISTILGSIDGTHAVLFQIRDGLTAANIVCCLAPAGAVNICTVVADTDLPCTGYYHCHATALLPRTSRVDVSPAGAVRR